MPSITPTRQRQPPNEPDLPLGGTPRGRSYLRPRRPSERPQDDSWVDQVADQVQAVLREHGLEMEMIAFYDPIGEQLHAVGFDGSPARFFRSLESDPRTDVEVPPSSTPS